MSHVKYYRVALLANLPTSSPADGDIYFVREDRSLHVWDAVNVAMRSIGGAVSSVAGRTGAVTLSESDIANLVSDLATLSASIVSEAATRASADTAEASARATADSSEASTRATADTTLQSNITSEASTRSTADGLRELLVNKDTDGTLAANSDTKYSSQKATKTYVDAEATARASAISSEASTRSSADTTLQSNIDAEATTRAAADALKAPLASPTFTGDPKAPTPSAGDNDTSIATTAFVHSESPGLAPVQSVAGKTGTVTLVEGDIASLTSDLALKAPLASPALTGSPSAPTASASDNSTKIATTAYADAAVAVEASARSTADGLRQLSSEKDANSGYAGLTAGGLLKAAEFPTPTTSTFGGIKDIAAVATKVVNAITNGIAQLVQLAFSDLSGQASLTTQVSGVLPPANGGVAAVSVAGEGYWFPEPMVGVPLTFSTNNTIAATANRPYMCQVVLTKRMKISALTFATGSAAGITAGNNFGFGIYNHDGTSLLLSINVAGVVGTSTAVRTTITPVTLDPGVYWVAWVCTLTTTTMNAVGNQLSGALFGNAGGSAVRWGHANANNASTAGSLPASLSLPFVFLAQSLPTVFCEP